MEEGMSHARTTVTATDSLMMAFSSAGGFSWLTETETRTTPRSFRRPCRRARQCSFRSGGVRSHGRGDRRRRCPRQRLRCRRKCPRWGRPRTGGTRPRWPACRRPSLWRSFRSGH
eukprot:27243_6